MNTELKYNEQRGWPFKGSCRENWQDNASD